MISPIDEPVSQFMRSSLHALTHELAQPVTVIRLIAEQMLLRPQSASTTSFQRIFDQVQQITAILNRARDHTDLPRRQPTSINALIHESIALACIANNAIGVQTIFVPDTDIELNIDKGQIEQVLVNLIRNAIEAIQANDGGYLTIKPTKLPHGVEIAVIDAGPGIDASVAGRIFQPFVTSKPNGAGVGLAISRDIARAHGGDLTVRSSDIGSCFVLYLPLE